MEAGQPVQGLQQRQPDHQLHDLLGLEVGAGRLDHDLGDDGRAGGTGPGQEHGGLRLAEVVADGGKFRIGARNRTILRKLVWKHNLLLAADDTGGNFSRTMSIDTECGTVRIRTQGEERTLWAA